MTIIACVDERNGMMFNRRRQSRDSVVCQDILRECSGKKLYMSAYSAQIFENAEAKVSGDILHEAGREDICFIEDTDITGSESQIDKVILYKWNRKYPADRYFPLDLASGSWELLQAEELRGTSHERITKEYYRRRQ